MPQPVISGQTLLDDLTVSLGGLSNVFNTDQLMRFVNDGLSEVWAVLRSLDLDYFMDSTQTTASTDEDYFGVLTTSAREYALPADCRDIRLIECTTAGYEGLNFVRRDISDEEFKIVRRGATANLGGDGLADVDHILYAVTGQNTLMFAQYPPAAITLKIWYVKSLPMLDVDQVLTEVLYPFSRKIVDYATEKALLSTRNAEMAAAWKQSWVDSIKMLAISSGPRDSTGPIYISDYEGS